MKKVFSILVLSGICFCGTPAFALFNNGGFETGDFTGWTLTGGISSGVGGGYSHFVSGVGLSDVIEAGALQSGQTLGVDPYQGSHMARLNDIEGNYHDTMISQTDTITQSDIDAGGTLYVAWGAMLIEPSNTHPANAQPYFSITVKDSNGILDSFAARADQNAGWAIAGSNGGDLWYKNDVWSYNFSNFSVGDSLTIELYVADCGWSGHGGFAFLDGIGVTNPKPVPEPTTMLLFGTGLAGLAAVGRRRTKN